MRKYEESAERDDEENMTTTLAELMDLNAGDTFRWDAHAYKAESIDTRFDPASRESLTVSDPTAMSPQDARAGTWEVPLADLFKSWMDGDIEPVSISTCQDRTTEK